MKITSIYECIFARFCLVVGILFGVLLQFLYGHHTVLINNTIDWIDIVGTGYVNLLQMIVMPQILISTLSAVTKLHTATSLGKLSILTISILLY